MAYQMLFVSKKKNIFSRIFQNKKINDGYKYEVHT